MMRRLFLPLCILLCNVAVAQSSVPKVTAAMSEDSIMIGDQFFLDINIERDMVQVTEFPVFENGMLTEEFEILSDLPVDTVSQQGRQLKLHKRYVLTCFKAGQYVLDGFPILFVDKNIVDTLNALNPMTMTVTTFEIDTTTQIIRDIKAPIKVPIMFQEFAGYLGGGLLLLALLIIGGLYLKKYIEKRRNRVPEQVVEPESAHEHALKELQKIAGEKLWQGGKVKQYYTRMTDVLRVYIENRYVVNAMEMTTAEIVTVLKPIVEKRQLELLSAILTTADYVKFAKYVPEFKENIACYDDAVAFVESTKLENVNQEEK